MNNQSIATFNSTNDNISLSNSRHFDPGSVAIGALLGLSTVPGILGNMSLISLIIYGKMLSSKKSVIYKMILNLAISDLLLLLGMALYLAPSSAMQDWLVSMNYVIVLGAYFGVAFYANIAIVCLIAMNRYFAVCRGSISDIPSNSQTIVSLVLIWVAAIAVSALLAIFSEYKFVYSYITYSFMYLGCCGENLRQDIWEIPQNIIVSVLSIYCYGAIYRNIHKAGNEVCHVGVDAARQKRRRREIRLAIQFAVITLVYTLMWVFFYIYPAVLTSSQSDLKAYALIAFLLVANCSLNAIVNLCFNEELHSIAKALASGHYYEASTQQHARQSPHNRSRRLSENGARTISISRNFVM